MHRSLTAGVLLMVAVLGVAVPAAADGTGDAYNSGGAIGVAAGFEDGARHGARGGGAALCRYRRLDDRANELADRMASAGDWAEQPGEGPGAWHQIVCDLNGRNGGSTTIVWLPDRTIDPEVLAEQALDRTAIPAPEIRLNPPAGQDQVVNVATWMWIDPAEWVPVSASASAGSVTVTATASPTSVRWDMGNGDVVVCVGPGTPYDPAATAESDCTYTYGRSSAGRPSGAFTMRVTMTWGVTWSVAGAPGGGSLGTAERTTTSAVRVAEIQAVNE